MLVGERKIWFKYLCGELKMRIFVYFCFVFWLWDLHNHNRSTLFLHFCCFGCCCYFYQNQLRSSKHSQSEQKKNKTRFVNDTYQWRARYTSSRYVVRTSHDRTKKKICCNFLRRRQRRSSTTKKKPATNMKSSYSNRWKSKQMIRFRVLFIVSNVNVPNQLVRLTLNDALPHRMRCQMKAN